MCTKEIVIATDWVVDSEQHAERIVLIRWKDNDGDIAKYSTHIESTRADKEGWYKPTKPNYNYGDYLDYLGNELNQKILDKFNKRRYEFFLPRENKWSLSNDGKLMCAVGG